MTTKVARGRRGRAVAIIPGILAMLLLAGCSDSNVTYDYPQQNSTEKGSSHYGTKEESIFGEGGLDLFGTGNKKTAPAGPGIAVNSFLWRATLDTIAFMPLSSADPFGGVIITDWYSPPETPRERYKMNVYILGRELRADGVKVAVFRERATQAGGWVPTTVSKDTAVNLENQILTRARQLRLASANTP